MMITDLMITDLITNPISGEYFGVDNSLKSNQH